MTRYITTIVMSQAAQLWLEEAVDKQLTGAIFGSCGFARTHPYEFEHLKGIVATFILLFETCWDFCRLTTS